MKKVVDYENKKNEYSSKASSAGFVSKNDQEKAAKDLENSKKVADKAKHELELREKDAQRNGVYSRVYNAINSAYKPKEVTDDNTSKSNDNKKKKDSYLSQSLSRYSKKEQKLIGNIYEIIKNILPKDTAEIVIKKIQEELK